MITIEAYRDAGDSRCDDVIEPLLGESLDAALCRARAELDAQSTRHQITTLELIRVRFDVRLGDLITAHDPAQGESWVGKVTGIKHRLEFGEIATTLTVERPIYA